MRTALYRTLLRLFRHLPMRVRLVAVHVLSPSYTVGAVCVLERRDGAVLFVRHSYRPRWGLPGGLCRAREDVADGARREVREEVGVAVALEGEPAVVVDAYERRVDVVFAARLHGGVDPESVAPASAEILECRWFQPPERPELQHEAAAALAALERLRRG